MDKRLLNLQADKVEMVLAAHKAPARVWGGRLTARTVQFHIAPTANTKLAQLESLTEEVALALGVQSARLSRTNGTLSLEIPRSDSRFVTLSDLGKRITAVPELQKAMRVPSTAILGLDNEGVPLLLRLSSPDVVHCLISGTTGSGKSVLAQTMVRSMVEHQEPGSVQFAVVDPKDKTFPVFDKNPYHKFLIAQVASDDETALKLVGGLVSLMVKRENCKRTEPRIILVIDELADIMQTCGAELDVYLTRLLQRGRSAGISVVACTQKPSAEVLSTLIRANFPARIVGRVVNSSDALVAAGVGGTGAEKLQGRGDFILVAGGQMIRFQAAKE